MASYSRTGQKWMFREDELLRKYFFQGNTITKISQELNREEDAIVFRLIKLGILGYNEKDSPQNHGTPWSSGELNELYKEYKQGKSISDIAKIHKRQKNAILYNLIKLKAFDITDRGLLESFKEDSSLYKSEDISSERDIKFNDGGNKMSFNRVTRESKTVSQPHNISGGVTGRNDAIYVKNYYQEELDKTWDDIENTVHYLETKNSELKEILANAPAIKKNIGAHEKERAELYTNLSNVLTKETNFEDKMWGTTQKGRKVKSITIKQKFKDSDVDEMRYDSMMEYLKQYPEYASKSTFKKILEKIEQKEEEIRKETEKFNKYIAEYNFRLNDFGKNIQTAEDKFEAYHKIKKEAEEKLKNIRYNKSILNKFRSEQSKAEANLDLLHHRVDQFENTLKLIKSEHSQSKKKMFVELEY